MWRRKERILVTNWWENCEIPGCQLRVCSWSAFVPVSDYDMMIMAENVMCYMIFGSWLCYVWACYNHYSILIFCKMKICIMLNVYIPKCETWRPFKRRLKTDFFPYVFCFLQCPAKLPHVQVLILYIIQLIWHHFLVVAMTISLPTII